MVPPRFSARDACALLSILLAFAAALGLAVVLPASAPLDRRAAVAAGDLRPE